MPRPNAHEDSSTLRLGRYDGAVQLNGVVRAEHAHSFYPDFRRLRGARER